ncbi:hypothetical protein J6590_088652 [Homalodisca vitripennis]|nr:hypothetical protein J6590_088652 [Homalodisca vitripennis]
MLQQSVIFNLLTTIWNPRQILTPETVKKGPEVQPGISPNKRRNEVQLVIQYLFEFQQAKTKIACADITGDLEIKPVSVPNLVSTPSKPTEKAGITISGK